MSNESSRVPYNINLQQALTYYVNLNLFITTLLLNTYQNQIQVNDFQRF